MAKRPDAADGRLVRLYLTERGRAARAPLELKRRALQEHALAGLTATERRHLETALAKIIRNLEGAAPLSEEGHGHVV